MKKTLFSLLLCCVVLAACKKDKLAPAQLEGTQKVTFKVGFAQTMGDIDIANDKNKLKLASSSDTSLTNYADAIYYMIFKQDGTLVQNITQRLPVASFGEYTYFLPPGNYIVAIAAGKSLFINESGNINIQKLSFADRVTGVDPSSIPDMFFKKMNITVGNNDVIETFTLKRATSKLTVNIKDALASTDYNLNLEITGVSKLFSVGTGMGENTNTIIRTDNNIRLTGPNYKRSVTFFYKAPIKVRMELKNSNLAGSSSVKTITDVVADPNSETILSGYFYPH